MKTVEHVIIGKDISRTATSALLYATTGASTNLAEGEVIVCDKNKKLLAIGSTIADTDTIYIGVGLSTTTTNPSGYTNRDIKWSAPIVGKDVKSYVGKAFAQSYPKKVHVTAGTIASGQEAVLRINYTDTEVAQLTPGQFVQEFRAVAASTGAANWCRRIVTKINADTTARVTATLATGSTGFHLVGKSKSGTTLNDIDTYTLVNFEPRIYNAYGKTAYDKPANYALQTTKNFTLGEGNWEQVRDKEKFAKAHEGLINPTTFPIPSGFTNWLTVKDETYDTIVIKHDNKHKTSDMGYEKATNGATYIYIPNTATTPNQMANVKESLNTWMSSLGFAEITEF